MEPRCKKLWTKPVFFIQDDQVLLNLVEQFGTSDWKLISTEFSGIAGSQRSVKQCKERFFYNLSPHINREWTEGESRKLFDIYAHYGNQWSLISRQFPGKNPNSVKNHFHATLRRNLRRFNKTRRVNEKISGDINEIFKIEEIRKILTSEKAKPIEKIWNGKKIKKKTMESLKNFGLILNENSEEQISEYIEIDLELNTEENEDFDVGYFLQQD